MCKDKSHALDTIEDVTPDQARNLIDQGKVKVLDVRRTTEFAAGHIEDATNIAHTRLAGRMDDVPTDATLLVNCRSGIRSASSASYLKRRGFDVLNLTGGILAWDKAQAQTA